MLRLNVIIASTRPGRVGPSVARWFHEFAVKQGLFDTHLVDLADFDLPVYDEPNHPRLGKYEHAHTRRWSESVAAADAFVFVTPEYNYGPTPALLNALNYVYSEWGYKPCSFVSYGGVSGGLRAVQMTKLTMSALRLVPIVEAVTIPMVNQHLKDGVFEPNKLHIESAEALLVELKRWAEALKPLRG
ncbi:NADPH-dependent FMN reductase [Chelatococcus composti]|mgnify:CR=1 FL=1|jgi:NAD(P)H-dependent FMN reductase|uniref:NAD(P)H-dependent FMN reductase n=1 Tax=Chelatococcus composti TaxID=1743235 RepID=A0A841K5F1_9HYPH|nr:NAD(P)H-dependent oxidoreductase [Chelatococcus composti]MBB6168028.1 NAD(P)H-dependent FMN reductase [Chelatococcus composti]MBS7734781.1 NAD(P)H-dependent oxidoreductase [Chelatococcus composti]PZN45440.1 MAG: NADPH-dependent FMN reductase [Pseudomonadota bacterium]GGG34090.1 FMN reductase [Chelatococcus composti]